MSTRIWFKAALCAVITVTFFAQIAQASQLSVLLFGTDKESQFPVGFIVGSYDLGTTPGGEYIPGGTMSVRLVLDDDTLKGLPYKFGYAPPRASEDYRHVETSGLYKNVLILEEVVGKHVKKGKNDNKNGGLVSDEYEITDCVSGSYTFIVGIENRGSRSRRQMYSAVVRFAYPKTTTTTKVTRRVTETAYDKRGKEIDEYEEYTPAQKPALVREAQDRPVFVPAPEVRVVETKKPSEPTKLTVPVKVNVSYGTLDVFGPARMRIATQIRADSYPEGFFPGGTEAMIEENGKYRYSKIKLPAVMAVSYWGPTGWQSAGVVQLTSDSPYGSVLVKTKDEAWLSDEEMDRYLELIDRLDAKQGSKVGQIERQRVARGEHLYWRQMPKVTTDDDWKYLSSVREPRRKEQLLEMLSLDVIHRGQGAFPTDKTMSAGWGYELAYQVHTYMDKQWSVRDGAKFYQYFATPQELPELFVDLVIPACQGNEINIIQTPQVQQQPPTFITPSTPESRIKPRTRIIMEEVEVEGWTSGAVRPEGLAGSTSVRYHKKGLWDRVVDPLTAYVGRTQFSVTTSASSDGASVGDVTNNATGGAGGNIGNINVSAEAEAAASAAADAAAAAESN